MTWLSWRQQRTETLIVATLLALLAAAFIPAGIHLSDLFAQQDIARCIGRQTLPCSFALGSFNNRLGFVHGLLAGGWFNLIPGLIGVALATPTLLDLENGTVRLAWTQSITRRRWIVTKLALTLGVALAASVLFSLLFTWYQRPLDRIYGHWDEFGFEGIVPLAYTLFALGLALAIGVLLRRSAAAMVVAFGAYVAVRLFVQSWLRQRLVTPLAATWGLHSSGPNISRAWVITEGPSDRAGHLFGGNSLVLQTCSRPGPKGAKGLDPACMARHGAGFTHLVYQPGSRFWEIQGLEFALFAGIAVLLIAFATWRVLASD
ncbi:MAG TPA: hypothetical protein VJ814_09505 [Gaiellaceae bacterium]|nr:hypothetical protein [Gaiellaceae bacterium]